MDISLTLHENDTAKFILGYFSISLTAAFASFYKKRMALKLYPLKAQTDFSLSHQ